MSDDNTPLPSPIPADATAASTTAASTTAASHMIPKERFDQVNEKRKAAEEIAAKLAAQLESLTAGDNGLTALEKKLQDQESRFGELEATLAAERRQRQALEIATAAGIGEWAADLKGSTIEEITNHAATLKDRIDRAVRSSTVGTPAPIGGQPAAAVDMQKLNDHKWVASNPRTALAMELARAAGSK